MASEESGIHEELFGRVDENVSAKQKLFAKTGIYKGELIPPQSKDFSRLMRTCLIIRPKRSAIWQRRSPV